MRANDIVLIASEVKAFERFPSQKTNYVFTCESKRPTHIGDRDRRSHRVEGCNSTRNLFGDAIYCHIPDQEAPQRIFFHTQLTQPLTRPLYVAER